MRFRDLLRREGVDPDEVIMDPEAAARRGLTPTVVFLEGNLAPEGAIVKATAIDPSVVGADGVYRHLGPARVFTTERAAIAAIKSQGPDRIRAGDVMVVMGRGPLGAGMEEIFQVTGALRHLDFGKHVAVITDARFSGVSTGACIGHVAPEALAGGPIGKLRDGDLIEIVIDRVRLEGSVNLVGVGERRFSPEEGARLLAGAHASSRSGAGSGFARGHASVGRTPTGERRAVGRRGSRRGAHPGSDRSRPPRSGPVSRALTPAGNRAPA
jgi:dihydroxyacid dehydratase/phosphogluconate dehydratase